MSHYRAYADRYCGQSAGSIGSVETDNGLPQHLSQLHQIFAIRRIGYNSKFLSSQPVDPRAGLLAQPVPQDSGDPAQHRVSDLVPVLVIHRLEAIDIRQQQALPGPQPCDHVEGAAIGEAREPVGVGHLAQPDRLSARLVAIVAQPQKAIADPERGEDRKHDYGDEDGILERQAEFHQPQPLHQPQRPDRHQHR